MSTIQPLSDGELGVLQNSMRNSSFFGINSKTAELAKRYIATCGEVQYKGTGWLTEDIRKKVQEGMQWGSIRTCASFLWNSCRGSSASQLLQAINEYDLAVILDQLKESVDALGEFSNLSFSEKSKLSLIKTMTQSFEANLEAFIDSKENNNQEKLVKDSLRELKKAIDAVSSVSVASLVDKLGEDSSWKNTSAILRGGTSLAHGSLRRFNKARAAQLIKNLDRRVAALEVLVGQPDASETKTLEKLHRRKERLLVAIDACYDDNQNIAFIKDFKVQERALESNVGFNNYLTELRRRLNALSC